SAPRRGPGATRHLRSARRTLASALVGAPGARPCGPDRAAVAGMGGRTRPLGRTSGRARRDARRTRCDRSKSIMTDGAVLREHAEHAYADELAAVAAADDRDRPPHWQLSPWAVAHYLLGGALPDGRVITPKYIGPRRIIEIAI